MSRSKHLTAIALIVVPLFASCVRPGGPESTSNEFGSAGVASVAGLRCSPSVSSSEPLPARAEVIGAIGVGSSTGVYFTDDLFSRFYGVCGGCHVDPGPGYDKFSVSTDNFAQKVTQDVIDTSIVSSQMPPSSIQYANRPATDPVVQLVSLLEHWLAAGSPKGSFSLTASGRDASAPATQARDAAADADVTPSDLDASAPNSDGDVASGDATTGAAALDASEVGQPPSGAGYTLSPALGAALSNVGSCIPSPYAVGLNTQTMDELDTFFAQTTELPDTLDKTDLTTFDSDVLARDGVVSYLPAYPLWSDAAGKMRHVRVPRGQSIAFDKTTQQFQIPPNTRFYKTFLKKVIDLSGQEAWKRIETRLIVSRPDHTLADGTITQAALFGTYVWNEDETHAVLLNDPLRDGLPFTDRVIKYFTDEPKAKALLASMPMSFDEQTFESDNPGLVRHYAIPGSQRCIQCHMGSPSASFVLGFTPLQVSTVPPGHSGVIEPASGDELTQLKRLIDDKVISGVTSPADILPLERTQLPRTPRNDYELTAQAYMVGNCAHCHNPRGFPSTKAPELRDVLNFLPGPNGGIFQFPLDRFSPLRARGTNQEIPLPYITPSLRDVPTNPSPGVYASKYVACDATTAKTVDSWCATVNPNPYTAFIGAPWRSLVYRNVDTPFDYVEDYAIFPHMPMNTPGYDCRVAQIMGDWMVSIPAARLNSTAKEDDVEPATADLTPQPYVEVKPGDNGYAAAQTAAQTRLASYHAGHRYNFCPNTDDIIDPSVNLSNPNTQTPPDLQVRDYSVYPPTLIMPIDGVPNRPHWVVTDTTDPVGDWVPRGSTWKSFLVDHQLPALANDTLDALVVDLPNVTLTDPVRAALTAEVPFGLWKQNPGCGFSGIPTAGNLQGDQRPAWMDLVKADPAAPVYMESAGEAVFTNICINCHGPQGDAKGLLADEVSLMTGGSARVANFRAGLFGPVDSPGANRGRVFGDTSMVPAGTGTPDDYGARYMAWMALGGTSKFIPQGLLNIVGTTPVIGKQRTSTRLETAASPNMLELAQELCVHTLLASPNDVRTVGHLFDHGTIDWTNNTALIGDNGDADLWLKLCSLNNRPVVRVLLPINGTWDAYTTPDLVQIGPSQSLFWGTGDASGTPYPVDAPVLDQQGRVVDGSSFIPRVDRPAPDNSFPVCVQQPTDPTQAGFLEAFRQKYKVYGAQGTSNPVPYCPASLFVTTTDPATGQTVMKWRLAVKTSDDGSSVKFTDVNNWATRGAINAGLAVFTYVDQLSKGLNPKPPYNQCESLGH
jgi:mono/diheme cytochrome c family protein